MRAGVFLADMTWKEAEARFRSGAVVVVPVGAAAKEHGPHLPLDTDYRTAKELGRRIAVRLPVVVAPVIGFGFYPAFTAYAGSQHLTSETFQALVRELLGNLIDHGITRIAIVNTGVSTEKPLRQAVDAIEAALGIRALQIDLRLLGRDADAILEQRGGGHADERETSVMLAIAPEAVRMDRAPGQVEGDGLSVDGVTGNPSLATRAKGERILDATIRDLVAALTGRFPELGHPELGHPELGHDAAS